MTIVVAPKTPPPRRASLIGKVSGGGGLDGSSPSLYAPHHPSQLSRPRHDDDGVPSHSTAPRPRSPLDPSSEDYDEEVAAAGFAITAIKHRSRSSSSSTQPPQKPIPRAALHPITSFATLQPTDLYTSASNEPVTHRKLRDDGKPRRPSGSSHGSPLPSPRRSVGSAWSTPSPSSSKRSHDDDCAPSPSSSFSSWSYSTASSSRAPNGESPPKRSRRPLSSLVSNQPQPYANEFEVPIIPPRIVITPPDVAAPPPSDMTDLESASLLSLIGGADPQLRKAIARQAKANAQLHSWLDGELERLMTELVVAVRGQQNGRSGNYAQMERNVRALVLAMERMLGVDPHYDPRSSNDFFGDGRPTFIGPRRALWWQSSLGGAELPGDDEHGSWTARLVQEERRCIIAKFFDEVFLQLDMAPVPLSLPEVLAVVCTKLLSRPDVERLLFDDSNKPLTFADHMRKYQRGPRTPSTWRTEGTMRPSRLRRTASVEQGKAFGDSHQGKEHTQSSTFREMLLERFDELLQRGQIIKDRSVNLKVPHNPRNTLRWAAYKEHEQRLLEAKMARIKSKALSPNSNEDEKLLAVNGRLEETFASLHCVRFLGELYRQGVVELDVIAKWLHRLLFDTMYPGIPSLWELESGCVLLITILPKLHEYQRQDGRAITMQRSFSAPQGAVKVGAAVTSSIPSHAYDSSKMDVDPPSSSSRPDAASPDHWIRTTPRRARLSALSKHSPVRKMAALTLDAPAPASSSSLGVPLTASSSSQHQQPPPPNIAAANLLHSCLHRLRELQDQPDIHSESKSWIKEVCRLSENTMIDMPGMVTPSQQQQQPLSQSRRQQANEPSTSSRLPLLLLDSDEDDDAANATMRGRSTDSLAAKSSSSSLSGMSDHSRSRSCSQSGTPLNHANLAPSPSPAPALGPLRPSTPSSRHRLHVEREQRREIEEREAVAALKALKHARGKAKRVKKKNTSGASGAAGAGAGTEGGCGYSSGSEGSGASSQLVGEV